MPRKLTDKQEAYKNNRIKGMPVGKAYKAVYDITNMSDGAVRKEASVLETDPRIALAIAEAKEKATDEALVTIEDVVKGLLEETKKTDDATTPTSRVSAWKALSDYTGGFDANKKKVELSGDKENPIALLIHEISGNTLEPNSE